MFSCEWSTVLSASFFHFCLLVDWCASRQHLGREPMWDMKPWSESNNTFAKIVPQNVSANKQLRFAGKSPINVLGKMHALNMSCFWGQLVYGLQASKQVKTHVYETQVHVRYRCTCARALLPFSHFLHIRDNLWPFYPLVALLSAWPWVHVQVKDVKTMTYRYIDKLCILCVSIYLCVVILHPLPEDAKPTFPNFHPNAFLVSSVFVHCQYGCTCARQQVVLWGCESANTGTGPMAQSSWHGSILENACSLSVDPRSI